MHGEYIALAAAAGFALFAFYSIFNNLIKARVIEDTPTSKIRSANQGYVELSGFARCYEDNLFAPLTGRPCLWYSYKIERYQSSGKSSSWRTLESKTSGSFFALQDETGECMVDPRRAEVSTSWIKIWRGNTRRPTTMETGSTSLLSRLSAGNYRYTEKIIQNNDYLYVLGMFQSIHAPAADQQHKQKMLEILNSWKQNYDQLVARFDSSGDGQLDMAEWEVARQQAASEAHDHVLENYNDNPVHVITYSPLPRNPYLIANQDPKLLSRKYRLRAFGMLVLFFLSAGFAVFIGLQLFGAPHRSYLLVIFRLNRFAFMRYLL